MDILKAEKEINKVKAKLIDRYNKIGLCENFGQNEIYKLERKLNPNPYGSIDEREIASMIQRLEDWAMNLAG